MTESLLYIASPYSHPDPAVREQRLDAAYLAVATLLSAGHVVFSPIVHSHPLTRFGLPLEWEFWERVDRRFLETCDEVVVLMLPGWEASRGVLAEIAIAWELGKPVRYVEPDATTTPTLARNATAASV